MAFVDHTTLRLDLSDPVHALSYIPYRFGFVPSRSLVFLSVRADGPRLQVGLAARIDLDDALNPTAGQALINRILTEAQREGARHVITAVFDPDIFNELTGDRVRPVTEPDAPAAAARQRAAALAHVLGGLFTTTFEAGGVRDLGDEESRPFSVELTYLVGADSWRCLACRHEVPCPPAGRPRTILADSTISVQMVYTGHGLVPSREALASVPGVDPGDRDTAQRAGTEALVKHRAVSGESGRDRAQRRARVIAEWTRVLTKGPEELADLGPARIGTLAASLADVQIRDAVLLAMCTATSPAYSNPIELKARLDALFANLPRPPVSDHHASTLLALMAGHCRGRLLAPVLATWAWCRWWFGDGTSANVLVDRCLKVDPNHELARLLNQLLRTNARPPWSAAA